MRKDVYTLITGASDGLGKAFAIECAMRKMNILLVALPGTGLQQLAALIRKNFLIDVVIFEKDLAKENSCEELYHEISAQHYSINVLINNVGMGNTCFFEEENLEILERQVRLNVLTTISLTHLFIPLLQKNKAAYILNVGSLASFFNLPGKQVYGGTKSFIYFFSKSLRLELSSKNISVSVLCPGGINSNPKQILFNRSGTNISQLAIMNPEEIAPLAMEGLLKRKEVIIPGKLNRLFLVFNLIVPAYFKKKIIGFQMGKFKKTNEIDYAAL